MRTGVVGITNKEHNTIQHNPTPRFLCDKSLECFVRWWISSLFWQKKNRNMDCVLMASTWSTDYEITTTMCNTQSLINGIRIAFLTQFDIIIIIIIVVIIRWFPVPCLLKIQSNTWVRSRRNTTTTITAIAADVATIITITITITIATTTTTTITTTPSRTRTTTLWFLNCLRILLSSCNNELDHYIHKKCSTRRVIFLTCQATIQLAQNMFVESNNWFDLTLITCMVVQTLIWLDSIQCIIWKKRTMLWK